jgi:4-hydroxy-tetrahydrodipicolinate synthase
MNNPFLGVGVALVSPFKKDMSIDFTALRRLVQLQINGGTDFLVVHEQPKNQFHH